MAPRKQTDSRRRIIEAAYDLFYRQGYQSTTVDEIIEQSGLSKPTVYAYFPTKEILCVEYLRERRQREVKGLRAEIRKGRTPEERFTGVIRYIREALLHSDYRGCGFFNMVSEIPDPESPVVKEAREFVERFREEIREVTLELRDSNPKYAGLDADRIANSYYLIVCGAIMASQEVREEWPLDRAVADVELLLETRP